MPEHLVIAWMGTTGSGILILGLIIGLLTGLFGVGGGFLLTPCLKVFAGMSYPLAVGSSLASICCTGTISAWRHGRRGNVAWRLGALIACGALIGAWLGKGVMIRLQRFSQPILVAGLELEPLDATLNLLFLLLLIAVFLVIAWERRHPRSQGPDDSDDGLNPLACRLHALRFPPHIRLPREGIMVSIWIPLGMGVGVGLLTGLLGVGGGFIMFPVLVYVLGLPTLTAVGTSAFQLVFSSVFGAWLYARQDLVHIPTVLLLVMGAMVGTEIGVRLSLRMDVKRLRGQFGVVVLVGIAVVLYDLLSMLWR